MPSIEIMINRTAHVVDANINLQQIICQFELPDQSCVFAINNQVIPKSEWQSTVLAAGDAISLFQVIAGG